jgi:hypothetical protein
VALFAFVQVSFIELDGLIRVIQLCQPEPNLKSHALPSRRFLNIPDIRCLTWQSAQGRLLRLVHCRLLGFPLQSASLCIRESV